MATMLPSGTRVMTTTREARQAGEVLDELDGPLGVLAVEQAGKRASTVPEELGRIMQQVLRVMAQGGTVTITSFPKELTTTSAAAVLGVSRPTLMSMIRDGRVASHMVGSHHRLFVDDVFVERSARRARERAAFAELQEVDDDD